VLFKFIKEENFINGLQSCLKVLSKSQNKFLSLTNYNRPHPNPNKHLPDLLSYVADVTHMSVVRLHLRKWYLFYTTSNNDEVYMQVITLDEIYNILVLKFLFKLLKCTKNMKFQQYINRVLRLVVLEK
jgi:hypothetical protein